MATNRRTQTKPKAHPLSWVALEAFADGREAIDAGELAALLGGRTSAYRTVAGHVLDSLEKRGLTWSNDAGQHRPVEAPSTPTEGDPFDGLTEVGACGFRYPTEETAADAFRNKAVPAAEVLDQIEECINMNSGSAGFVVAVVPIRADGTAERWSGPDRP